MNKGTALTNTMLLMLFAVILTGSAAFLASGADVGPTPLSIEEIKALTKAGVSDAVIISQIKATRAIYHLSTEQIIELKTVGVSQEVIDCTISTAMNQPLIESATNTPAPSVTSTNAPPPPAAAITPPTPEPAPSAYVAPMPVAAYRRAPPPPEDDCLMPCLCILPLFLIGGHGHHGGGHRHHR